MHNRPVALSLAGLLSTSGFNAQNINFHNSWSETHIVVDYSTYAFSALTLLVGRQEGHPACKKRVVGAGVVVCLARYADSVSYTHLTLPTTPYV